jgi:hypothetical protein
VDLNVDDDDDDDDDDEEGACASPAPCPHRRSTRIAESVSYTRIYPHSYFTFYYHLRILKFIFFFRTEMYSRGKNMAFLISVE